MRRIAAALLFVLFLACPLFAQEGNAALTGFIQDSSKAMIPDVRVLAINTDTNQHFEAATNKDGSYNIASLPVGPYRMQIEKPGFRTILKEGIFLHTQDVLQVNFQMAVGSTDETITVSGEGAAINTTDGSVSTVIDRQFVENLPLNGRSFQSLIYLTPGVTLNAGSGPSSNWATGQFTVNGQRASSNYWMIDGVSANIGITPWFTPGNGSAGVLQGFNVLGGTNSLVSIDAMQEFRIQTSTYAPELGRTPGGQILITTRSGTNQFHGSLFDYFRNGDLDATDWFATHYRLPKSAEQQNDFGGVLGGPIVKDKIFFFGSYEGLRLNQPETYSTTVPDLAARQSAIPAMQPYINAYPLPNPGAQDLPGVPGLAPFNATFSNPANVDAYSLRLDAMFTNKLSAFARYDHSPSRLVERGGDEDSANTVYVVASTINTGTLGTTWTHSSQLVNETRFNYSDTDGKSHAYMDTFGGGAVLPGASLFPSPYTYQTASFNIYPLFGTNTYMGEGLNVANQQNQYNIVDTLSLEKARHSLKIGVDYRRLSPEWNPRQYDLFPLFSSVQQMAAGVADYLQADHYADTTFLFRNLGVFAQDTWRIGRRLTLTYGLRWDVDFAPTTQSGPSLPAVTGFSLTDLSNLALAPSGTSVYSTRYGNVAPRVGGAYQISQSPEWGRVLRSGVGVFYDLASTEAGNKVFAYPFNGSTAELSVPFPLASPLPLPAILPPSATQGTLDGFDPHLNLPYTVEWSVALEQELGKSQTVTASYLGSSGKRLLATESIASPNPNFLNVNLVANEGNSDYEALQLQFRRRLSVGLQALASYTWAHSIDTGSYGEYTNGSFANVSANRGNSDFDIRNSFSGALTYDVPSIPSNATTRALFGGWSTETVVQARSASPVDITDGAFTALLKSNASVLIRPDVVPGQPVYLHGSQYPGRKALNPSAFTNPPVTPVGCVPGVSASCTPTRQGDLGRNALSGFGLAQWDFAVHREFNFSERLRLQFRAEMFNVLNHPNFGPYDTNFGVNDPSFGLSTQMFNQASGNIGGTAGNGGFNALYQLGGPRSIQLALKLSF
jgi:carboxypeptidase family protein